MSRGRKKNPVDTKELIFLTENEVKSLEEKLKEAKSRLKELKLKQRNEELESLHKLLLESNISIEEAATILREKNKASVNDTEPKDDKETPVSEKTGKK